MTFQITSAYAAVLGLVAIFLSFQVIQMRAKTKVSLLDGDNTSLKECIRRHGNFTEYVPLALILMGFAEAGGASSIWLHAIGASFSFPGSSIRSASSMTMVQHRPASLVPPAPKLPCFWRSDSLAGSIGGSDSPAAGARIAALPM